MMGDYSYRDDGGGGGGGGGDADPLSHCNMFRKSLGIPICHHFECRWFCLWKICPV